MGTKSSSEADALFGKTRQAILGLLFSHPDESFYLRQIVRAANVGLGAVQRELENLAGAGILSRSAQGNQVHYRANTESPIFSELKSLVVKTVAGGNVLRRALLPLAAKIGIAFVFGSVARGEQQAGSDIDVMIVGDVAFADIVSVFRNAEEDLRREINPVVYSVREFQDKVTGGQAFMNEVLAGPKIFLIGNEHELAAMVEERMAGGDTSKQKRPGEPPRNS